MTDVQQLLRECASRKGQPTAVAIDNRTLQSTPESGAHAGYDGAKRGKSSKVHIAVDTLSHLLALKVTAADEGDRAQVAALAEQVQEVTGQSVELTYVNQGSTGSTAARLSYRPPFTRSLNPSLGVWRKGAAVYDRDEQAQQRMARTNRGRKSVTDRCCVCGQHVQLGYLGREAEEFEEVVGRAPACRVTVSRVLDKRNQPPPHDFERRVASNVALRASRRTTNQNMRRTG